MVNINIQIFKIFFTKEISACEWLYLFYEVPKKRGEWNCICCKFLPNDLMKYLQIVCLIENFILNLNCF